MYIDTFRNTLVVDILEAIGLVQLEPNFRPQPPSRPSQLALPSPASSSTTGSEVDVEVDVEKDAAGSDQQSRTESSTVEDTNPFLVDWNGPDDIENPKNWPRWKKGLVVFQAMFLTSVTYAGSSIYTPGQLQIQEDFKVGHVVATLNLSIYVLGYGIGPMIFSPLSEVATLGRNHIYMVTLFLFFMLQIPAALANSIGGLIVIRFITGFLSSPAVSTVGATLGDFISPDVLPKFIGLWAVGAVAAPVLAPLLGAAMVDAESWRFIFWLLMWLCAFAFLILSFFFPETLASNLLHRRANRLRKQTGDARYYTTAEVETKNVHIGPFLKETFWRPFAMIIEEPGVLAFDIYIALAYGTFYLFFEAFPIVFSGVYHFTLVETGLAYFGFCVGCALAYGVLIVFLNVVVTPRVMAGTFSPEHFLILAMWVCFFLPAALLLFGWGASTFWIVPVISEVLFVLAVFNIFQCGFGYLAMNYPRYLASVYAGNALIRSSFACAFPLFGQAMYDALATPRFPVAWGSTLLAFVTLVMAAIPFVLYRFGAMLRGRSKYAN
jgi:DHA1 family multidrug resistance protein-like MFS transporter